MLEPELAAVDEADALGLSYRFYLPATARSGEGKHPAVFLVHGRAGDSKVMWIFSKALEQVKPIVLAPQAFIPDSRGGCSWWDCDRQLAEGETRRTRVEDLLPALARLEQFIERACEKYPIDRTRLYAAGFSMGAAMVSSLSLRNPALFQGVAMLAGFLPPVLLETPGLVADEVRQGRNTLPRYFIFHGSNDLVVPFDRAERAAKTLRGFGAQVELHAEEVGHKVGAAGMRELRTWFENQLTC